MATYFNITYISAVKRGKFRNSVVAIKTLLSGTSDEQTIESFKKEAEILCKVKHPNIVLCMGITIPK